MDEEKERDLTTAHDLRSLTIKAVLGQPKTWMLENACKEWVPKTKKGQPWSLLISMISKIEGIVSHDSSGW